MAMPELRLLTIISQSIEPAIPYGYGRQNPIIPPTLSDPNLSLHPFKILTTRAVVQPSVRQCDERERPQSPVQSELSSISTPLMIISTVERWETSSDAGISFLEDELRRIVPLSSPSKPRPASKQKRRPSIGMTFPKTGGVSQHVCQTSKHAGKCCQRKRTSQVPLGITMGLHKQWTLFLSIN